MRIEVKVEYVENKKIKLTVGEKSTILLSDESNKVLASNIYNTFNHKKGKKYLLNKLEIPNDIPSDYEIYLKECYELIEGIINDIK